MPKESNKERVLAALINTPSIREAATACGIGEATIYRYLQDKKFLGEYRNARLQTIESAIAALQSATGEAVQTLTRNLHAENPAIEIRAADLILTHAFKGTETLDILERLETIENEFTKQIEENGKSNNKRF